MEFHAKITPEQVKVALANDAKKKAEKAVQVVEKGVASNPPTANLDADQEEPERKTKTKKKELNGKPKKEPKAKGKKAELTFPTTIRINAYGFIGVNKPLLAALGWKKDMALVVVKNPDGSATLRKT